ncbi:response regulator [Halonatronum saccharophilum]|uniref:response regulator n=1 Tax=Halonatronum saccharophilum TaxID=150060 RepID=UPI00047FDF53|nr:response regulator [Halonatronum saccharophilum]
MKNNMVKVLIVNDSLVVRRFLKDTLEQDASLKVVGEAKDPYIAVKKVKKLDPDVLTLDVEMPKMNGLELLKK